MPVYDYKCTKCGKAFEYTQRITEDALEFCPVEICEQETKGIGAVQRQISKNIGLVFKGSGFYLTDYVHKGSKQASSLSTSSNSETSSSTETKTDSASTSTTKTETSSKSTTDAA